MDSTTELRRIEEELAHLHRLGDELSDIVARQSAEIDLLTRRVAMLMDRAARSEQEQTGGAVFADERPPHY
ncbi:SlyX family protein [Tropicimonas sp. IMCC34043]|uniref:SlyX family protein n=1 Tax=Tropicimonas sp. IMCC34043 TaxID=2248760 RepID=UPI000E25F29E|nr:SlyX family protein [Tropicimonas sp. IMCC34043]